MKTIAPVANGCGIAAICPNGSDIDEMLASTLAGYNGVWLKYLLLVGPDTSVHTPPIVSFFADMIASSRTIFQKAIDTTQRAHACALSACTTHLRLNR